MKSKYLLKCFCLFIICLSAFGCSHLPSLTPVRMYDGAPLDKSQVARIYLGEFLTARKIDGKEIRELRLEVLPGEHTMEVAYGGILSSSNYFPMPLEFNAEAGQVYNVEKVILHKSKEFFMPKRKIFIWMHNNKTKKVVAGYKPEYTGSFLNTFNYKAEWDKGYPWK